jgi:hypothetical protein
MKSMLLTVAVLGLMSVASACEISGYKYEKVGEETVPVEGWTIYLHKLVNGEFVYLTETKTDVNGYYHFSEADKTLLPYPKSVYGTYRVYEESRPGWTQLYPTTGFYEIQLVKYPIEGRKVSDLNFINERENVCYKDETAWTDGPRYVKKGNWATYTPYAGQEKTVDIYAGKTIKVGTATFSAPDAEGNVTITIDLKNGASFADVKENLKIQGYTAVPPAKNPAPGKFTTYKGTLSGSSVTVTVPQFAYYGVHLDVKVPC